MYILDFNMPFNRPLVRDEEPLLLHVKFLAPFPVWWDALVMLIEPVKFSHLTWSHFASDDSNVLNDWTRRANKRFMLNSLPLAP